MKHRSQGRKFGRVRSQRRALLKTLMGSLIQRERIVTTEAKAKEIKARIDRVVTIAKKISDPERKVAILRLLASRLPKMAVEKFADDDFRKRFEIRTSGFTRVTKLPARKSDSAKMAVVEFVD
ncbi:MAG: 50S ribosomal protein L17 [Candidatus Moraniibacteriota bacterium]|nr:MAG: 50S ribosomal protein L17 [Candidatus Moranbacteria bacterium]